MDRYRNLLDESDEEQEGGDLMNTGQNARASELSGNFLFRNSTPSRNRINQRVSGGSQEVPPQADVQACWSVINQQAAMLQTQQDLLKNLTEQMTSLRTLVTTMANSKPPASDQSISVTELASLLDRKGAPPPEPFSVTSEQSFKIFLSNLNCTVRANTLETVIIGGQVNYVIILRGIS